MNDEDRMTDSADAAVPTPEPLQAEADKVIVGTSFTVEIAGHGFLPIKEKRGGKPEGEQADVAHGLSKPSEATVGHSSISELELVAFVGPHQMHFADIVKRVAIAGEQYRVNITVTELAKNKTPVKTYHFSDCLITSYDYPRFEAGSGELMTETATFKPTRLEVS